jgi:multidrug efflux pump subunit AcrB
MNWNFSAWAIRNPVPPILLFAVLMLLGVQSFMRLPITQFPNIDVPVIAVSVGQSGAAPAELESQITKRVEDAVSGLAGVKNVTSTMSDGISSTAIEFRLEVPTDQALEDVKDAIAKVRGDFPGGVDEPIIQKIDVEGASIQTYAVKAPGMTLEQLSWYVDDVVKRQVQGLPGVGRVDRYGGADREIRVDIDPAKLQALGVTASYINQQLSAINADSGAGKSEVGGAEQAIRTLGGARDLESLKDTTLPLPGGNQIKLRDLATITDTTEEPKSFARFNGDAVVTFSVFRAKGASSVDVGNRVSAKVLELDKPNDAVAFSLVDDTVFSIYGNYQAAMAGLIEGAVLAVIVVLIFLRDWRATLISALSLPLSAIPTFWVMDLLGFSLNLVSFLGITLATGILVDDAIVEIENIARHMRMGKSAYRASMDAADEIGLAVIAITFTIVAVFVPVSFMGGVVGQYFKQFGMTVAVAVLFSLLVARLITPMMSAYLMRAHGHEEEKSGFILQAYVWLLKVLNWAPNIEQYAPRTRGIERLWFLFTMILIAGLLIKLTANSLQLAITNSSWSIIAWINLDFVMWAGALGLFILLVRAIIKYGKEWKFGKQTLSSSPVAPTEKSVFPRLMSYVTICLAGLVFYYSTTLIPLLPTGFIPRGDESRFVLGVELPPGSRLEETQKITDGMAATIRKNPDVSHVFVLGGSSPLGSLESRYASIYVNLNKRDHNLLSGIVNNFIAGANRFLGTSFSKMKTNGRETPQWDVESAVLPQLINLPDVRMYKVTERGTREIEFNMLSNDPVALAAAVAKLEGALRQEPTLRSVMGVGALDRPEVKIVPRTEEAAKLGITAAQISQAVRVAMIGDFDTLLAKFNAGDRLLPIRVQTPESARTLFSDITNLRITTASGQTVPLSSVAEVTFSQGPSSIKRLNRQRQATLGADIMPGTELGTATERINEVAKSLNFPPSVKIQEGGDAEIQGDINREFIKAASLGVVLMMGVLVLLLGNVFQPFAIILSLPLSIGGVVIALLMFDKAFSMPVIIGMLMLIGIVAKNGIMLVDFAVERVKHGMGRLDAIVDAGRKRARPIVMTTLAMGAGMLPSAMGIGEGGEFRSPMAIAVIGGLIAATFLSLIFVPSFYIVMDDLARLTRWIFGRFIGASDEPKLAGSIEELAVQQSKTETALEQLTDKIEEVEERLRGRSAPTMKAAE